ncbi:MAG: hypothetical protein JW934_11925, partial [Anaerolineae bacterium]|nr:hypothetical protein [Anaerolineae bacterium]
MSENNRIGEIIETGTTLFVAESFALHQPPALGRLVYVQNEDVSHADVSHGYVQTYGVVCFGTTASPDPGRRAVRRSTDGVYDEAIYHEHPQLERTLHTEFTVRLVGYSQNDVIYRYLPPTPPPLHFSVLDCNVSQVRAFTERLTYLRLLLQASEIPPDQLLAAHVRQAYRARGGDNAWLAGAARLIAGLL